MRARLGREMKGHEDDFCHLAQRGRDRDRCGYLDVRRRAGAHRRRRGTSAAATAPLTAQAASDRAKVPAGGGTGPAAGRSAVQPGRACALRSAMPRDRGGAQRQLILFGPIGAPAATLDSAASARVPHLGSGWSACRDGLAFRRPGGGGGHAAATQVAGHGPGPGPGAAPAHAAGRTPAPPGGQEPARADVVSRSPASPSPVRPRPRPRRRPPRRQRRRLDAAAAAYPRAGHGWPDVRELQRRLAALHYYPGAADGRFGQNTLEALWAFQAVQGLAVTGSAGPATRQALARPRTPRSARPGGRRPARRDRPVAAAARPVPVRPGCPDQPHLQRRWILLLLAVGGRSRRDPRRRLPYHGVPACWVTVPLREMYNPVFFIGTAYAIHGSASVPLEPSRTAACESR